MNSYSSWQRYEGQSYHRADFEVTRAYFQRGSKGGISVYASGTVDGQREWMDLESYVPTRPRSQSELDEQVPTGTSIPIYLFPDLKGRSRVRVFAAIPACGCISPRSCPGFGVRARRFRDFWTHRFRTASSSRSLLRGKRSRLRRHCLDNVLSAACLPLTTSQ